MYSLVILLVLVRFCVLTTVESRAKILACKIYLNPLVVLSGGSVVVNSFFYCCSLVCGGFVFGPCYVM